MQDFHGICLRLPAADVAPTLPLLIHTVAMLPLRSVLLPGTGYKKKKEHNNNCIKAANCSDLGRVLRGPRAKQLEADSVSEGVTSMKPECSRLCSSRSDSPNVFWMSGRWHLVISELLRVEHVLFIFFFQKVIKVIYHWSASIKKYFRCLLKVPQVSNKLVKPEEGMLWQGSRR